MIIYYNNIPVSFTNKNIGTPMRIPPVITRAMG
jgi:hypothetical protein